MMGRFVLLHHLFPPGHERNSHWDLMLEWEGHLLTWELSSEFALGLATQPIPVRRLADHRLEYLDYEGPISRNRGEVQRVMEGNYRWLGDDQTTALLFTNNKTFRIEFEQQASGDPVLHVSPGTFQDK